MNTAALKTMIPAGNLKIDLHMHSTVSDGTDTPEDLIEQVRKAGIRLFALTDHDDVKGYGRIRKALTEDDPVALAGVEFSCRDPHGKYHILGYGFDPDSRAILNVVETGHRLRMKKTAARLDHLETELGFTFPEEEIRNLLSLDNPGKPHIGNLMVKYGYAESKDLAIKDYLNHLHIKSEYVDPEQAIRGILDAGGIPVLAHPPYGSGNDMITGDEMDKRLRRLIGFGLQGVEAFYSGFTPKLQEETLSFADRYGLYVTAGSDYHGKNKTIRPGQTGLDSDRPLPEGLRRFLEVML